MVEMELWVNDPTPVLTGGQGRGLLVLCTGSALAGALCVSAFQGPWTQAPVRLFFSIKEK